MDVFKRFLLTRYFIYLAIFLIAFCIASVILLDVRHPLYVFSIGCGLLVYFLMRYRKKLLERRSD